MSKTCQKSDRLPALQTVGETLCTKTGDPAFLLGVDLGPWLCADHRLHGLPGDSDMLAMMLREQCGEEKAEVFFSAFEEAFLTKRDIAAIRELGANLVWVPLDYRLFCGEELTVSEYARGFSLLDRLLKWCEQYELYCIPQLRIAPGGQNRELTGEALLFEDGFYQEQFLNFWGAVAKRYHSSRAFAGYALLYQPEPEKGFDRTPWEEAAGWKILNSLYAQAVEQIRASDPEHLILLSGRHGGGDFSGLRLPETGNIALLEDSCGTEKDGSEKFAENRAVPIFRKIGCKKLPKGINQEAAFILETYKGCYQSSLLCYAEDSPYVRRFGDILCRYGQEGQSICGFPVTEARGKMEAGLLEFQRELRAASGNPELPLREEEMKRWIDLLYYSKQLAFAFSKRVASLSAEELRKIIFSSVKSEGCVKNDAFANALRFLREAEKGRIQR